ncbi:MAG TPA: peptidoglycan-binding domain-containing protein, partial [Solirubrobacter sp.]|nr:peptidoglycan-binding domain-containing protein [Solirubrobacter sp.]
MRRAGLALALALLFPASAAAQTPSLKVSAKDTFAGGVALTSRSFTARVVMRPYVEGETVTLRVYRGGKKIRVKALTLKPVDNGAAGVVELKVKSAKPGRVLLRASHRATPALGTLRAKTVGVTVVTPSAGPGARGPAVRLLQAQLAKLKYVVPRTGVFDAGTANAVMAWRKVMGMARTTLATKEVFAGLLAGR